MNKKLNKKRNSVVFSVSLPTEHDDLYRIIERFVFIYHKIDSDNVQKKNTFSIIGTFMLL